MRVKSVQLSILFWLASRVYMLKGPAGAVEDGVRIEPRRKLTLEVMLAELSEPTATANFPSIVVLKQMGT